MHICVNTKSKLQACIVLVWQSTSRADALQDSSIVHSTDSVFFLIDSSVQAECGVTGKAQLHKQQDIPHPSGQLISCSLIKASHCWQ